MTDAASASGVPSRARQRSSAPTSPSPVTWSSQPDDVSGLLAAELAALALQRLQHVAVADVGRHHPHAPFGHQLVEAEVGHRRDRDEVDAEVEGHDRENLVTVDGLARGVDREHPVAVAVERDAEVETRRR